MSSVSGTEGVDAPPAGAGVGVLLGGVLGVTVVDDDGVWLGAGEPEEGGGTPTTTLPFADPGFASGPFVGA